MPRIGARWSCHLLASGGSVSVDEPEQVLLVDHDGPVVHLVRHGRLAEIAQDHGDWEVLGRVGDGEGGVVLRRVVPVFPDLIVRAPDPLAPT